MESAGATTGQGASASSSLGVVASDFTVSAVKFRGIVNSATGVFTKPDRLSNRQRRLEVGDTVRITGRVENRLWYQIELKDGATGYVSMGAVDRL